MARKQTLESIKESLRAEKQLATSPRFSDIREFLLSGGKIEGRLLPQDMQSALGVGKRQTIQLTRSGMQKFQGKTTTTPGKAFKTFDATEAAQPQAASLETPSKRANIQTTPQQLEEPIRTVTGTGVRSTFEPTGAEGRSITQQTADAAFLNLPRSEQLRLRALQIRNQLQNQGFLSSVTSATPVGGLSELIKQLQVAVEEGRLPSELPRIGTGPIGAFEQTRRVAESPTTALGEQAGRNVDVGIRQLLSQPPDVLKTLGIGGLGPVGTVPPVQFKLPQDQEKEALDIALKDLGLPSLRAGGLTRQELVGNVVTLKNGRRARIADNGRIEFIG